MRKLLIFILVLVVVSSGCYHEVKPEIKVPERLLPEDTFVMVLADIQIAEGAIEYRRENHIYKNDDMKRFYAYVYEKYHLTPELLKENMDYYNTDPDRMVEIYDKVLAKLMETQAEMELKKKAKEERIRDSLAQIDTTIYVRRVIKPKPASDLKKIWPIWKK